MIYDLVKNAQRYHGISKNVDKALDFMLTRDLASLKPDKYLIDGDNVFVIIQEPKTIHRDQAFWGSHKNHIDIQYLIDGKESIGIQKTNTLFESSSYNSNNDITFYEDDGKGFFVHLLPGQFVICFPDDAHMPLIGSGSYVKKAVFKIRID